MTNRGVDCRGLQVEPPSITPVVAFLSAYSCKQKTHQEVVVHGDRFFPPAVGTTMVQFGGYGYVPITYHHSRRISFLVPRDAFPGTYPVSVCNVNDNVFNRGGRFSTTPTTVCSVDALPFTVVL